MNPLVNYDELVKEYQEYQALHLKLDMSRGKPSPEQLQLSEDILLAVSDVNDCISDEGLDCRNYGGFYGLQALRDLFGEELAVPSSQVLIGGVSSLSLMYDVLSTALLKGMCNSEQPWCREEKVRFICPVPGYDRHYTICEKLGFEMISVPLLGDGPDMDMVEALVEEDESIKGIWCVPLFSNPTGDVYSLDTLERLANLHAKAKDFTVMMDNAYAVHTLSAENKLEPVDFYDMCVRAGYPNRPILFASMSKVTFASASVSCVAFGPENFEHFTNQWKARFISQDKMNQLRHIRVFPNVSALHQRMEQHARILLPKFEMIDATLTKRLNGCDFVSWTKPTGGYFITLKVAPHTARRVFELCRAAGVVLTSPGAGFPYNEDPNDEFIRLAPSYPSVEELKTATDLLCVCVMLAYCEQQGSGALSSLMEV